MVFRFPPPRGCDRWGNVFGCDFSSHKNYGGQEYPILRIGRELQFAPKMTDVSCAHDKKEKLGARKSVRPKGAPLAPGAGVKNDPHNLQSKLCR
jgi:hypothetical protein